MRMYRQAVVGVLLALGLAPAAPAPNPPWTGKTVMVKKTGLMLVDDPKKEKPAEVGRLTLLSYKVLNDRDGWLRVRDRTIEGWVRKSDLVLLDDAVKVYTEQIQQNPRNASLYYYRAVAHRLKGAVNDALLDLTETVRLVPSSPFYHV